MKEIIIIKKVINRVINKCKYFDEKMKYYKYDKGYRDGRVLLQEYKSNLNIPFGEYEEIYRVEQEAILKEADLILAHKFTLLGEEIDFQNEIQWNMDFGSKYIWENKFYKDIKIIDYSTNADVKLPWELSRFQHIYILIYSFKITRDTKYIREIENQLMDWITQNPYRGSVNWTCAMEVAIRACNWIVAISFMDKNNILSEDLKGILNKSLYEHGEYIYNNLEKNIKNSNNHYIADLVGLIWIGMYFEDLHWRNKTINKWLTYALKELEKEIDNQILKDGVNYEISIPYHCLVTEMIVYTVIMLEKNNKVINNEILNTIEKMLEFVYCATKKNENIPLIGDMDSGRFMLFTAYGIKDKRNFSHLINFYNSRFNPNDIYNNVILKEESGYSIYKTNKYEFITRCGMNAMYGQGNHNHNDNLSFELNVECYDFIVDPGTFCYTRNPRIRNQYRSTSYHNTLQIEGIEQNDFNEKYLFRLENQSNAYYECIGQNYIKGKIEGYYPKCEIIYERTFKFSNNEINIFDHLKGEIENKNIYIRLYLDSNVEINRIDKNMVILSVNSVKVQIFSEHEIDIEIAEISPEYGVRIISSVLKVKLKSKSNNIKIKFI